MSKNKNNNIKVHAMVDLETISTNMNATILSLGGVKFNPYNNNEPNKPIYIKPDVDEQAIYDRDVDDETIKWWGKQSKIVQEEAFSEDDRLSLNDFCFELNKWLVGVDVIWAQGSGFDMTILESLYKFALKENR